MSSKRKATDTGIICLSSSSSPSFRCERSALELCDMRNPKKLKRGDDGSIDFEDRISSLPDVVLADILSFLATKDAVITSALSRRWRRVYTWVTRLDFDGSLISHCLHSPSRSDSFPTFKMFVDNVLHECQAENITSFRLHFGKGDWPRCRDTCFLTLEPQRFNAWLCYPLTRGVRVLDIFVRVKKPCKLPSAIFSCQTLEVLKLDMNLDLEVPSYLCLPNLKVLHLYVVFFPDDDSVTRLVSSCPSLEQLTLEGRLNPVSPVHISSPSLRSLDLTIIDWFGKPRSKLVLDVPNLEYLYYDDTYALNYSIGDLNVLVEAQVDTFFLYTDECQFENIVSFISPLCNVHRLFLMQGCVEALSCCEFKQKLPVFRNLKHLQLGCLGIYYWNKVLMELLTCAPFLETLSFPQGIAHAPGEDYFVEVAELECHLWRGTHLVPSCLGLYLKRISIKEYELTDWELEIVRYFLKNASVLEELDLVCKSSVTMADRILLDAALQKLTRGSITCSVKVL